MLCIEKQGKNWTVTNCDTRNSRQLYAPEIGWLKVEFPWLAIEKDHFVFCTDRIQSVKVAIERRFPKENIPDYRRIRKPSKTIYGWRNKADKRPLTNDLPATCLPAHVDKS